MFPLMAALHALACATQKTPGPRLSTAAWVRPTSVVCIHSELLIDDIFDLVGHSLDSLHPHPQSALSLFSHFSNQLTSSAPKTAYETFCGSSRCGSCFQVSGIEGQ